MTAIYPGSFDPLTNGHVDIIRRCADSFEKLIVGILVNPSKKYLLSQEERVRHLKLTTQEYGNIEVKMFSGMLMEFAKENNAGIIIRGIRFNAIGEYEMQMALGNKSAWGLETFFMPSAPEFMYLSSTIVKEVMFAGGSIDGMVPQEIAGELRKIKLNLL